MSALKLLFCLAPAALAAPLPSFSAYNDFKHVSQTPGLKEDPSVVYTKNGYVEGTLTATNRVFRAIPYAEPPVNASGRWKSPRAVKNWGPDYVLEAKGDPPACMQKYCGQWEACGRQNTQDYSEDCLYLNVNTPINISNNSDSSELLPVMFWIHGGEWENGYGGGFLYNGSDLANLTNVITVTINYRLGIFGFYWNERLGFEGNYAIEDQILALQWVQDNIEYFGGDPKQVTVFGQSAGAMSIGVLGSMNQTKDLYSKAIWESEPLGIPMRTAKTWGEIPELFVALTDCDKLETEEKEIECLYSVDSETALNVQTQIQSSPVQLEKFMDAFVPWTATIGTGLIPEQPLWYYNGGNTDGKPLLAGVVHDEAPLFIYTAFPDGIPYAELVALLHIILKTEENVQKITAQYPIPTNVTDYRAYASLVVTDGLFHCPNRNVTATLSNRKKGNENNIFFYHFEHVPSFGSVIWDPINATECLDQVCHGDDLPFVFRPNSGPLNVTLTPAEENLAKAMQFYWTDFAKTAYPGTGRTAKYNNGSEVEWSRFNSSSQDTMIFRADAIQMIGMYDEQKCKVWDEVNYPWVPHP